MDRLQLVMPVHNEGPSIEATLREWYEKLHNIVQLEFLIYEDGSTDATKEVLTRISSELPIRLDMSEERRGYGRAMLAGLRASSSPWVLTSDSDGQSEPEDFRNLWARRGEFELIVGWRVNRADHRSRKLLSGLFKLVHRLMFGTTLHDPSCNVMLIKRCALEKLCPQMAPLVEGFQWELVARAKRTGVKMSEVPIHHRPRAAGGSVVFRARRIPGIAWRNGLGLLRLWLGGGSAKRRASWSGL